MENTFKSMRQLEDLLGPNDTSEFYNKCKNCCCSVTQSCSILSSPMDCSMGFPCDASGKEPTCQFRRLKRHQLDPWIRRSPGGGLASHSSSLAWRIPMDRGAWRATVHRVPKSWPWLKQLSLAGTAACQASLTLTVSQSLLKFMPINSVMPSNHLILCCPLLLLPSVFPGIRVFPSESALCIRWPNYWSFSINIHPSSEYSELISFRIDWFDLLSVQGTLQESSLAP